MTKLETFANLGLKVDPFYRAVFNTGDALRVERILTMAVASKAMISIVGPRGVGKTLAVQSALDKIGCRVVLVAKSQKDKLSISEIEQALILDLSDETPKRGGEVRARQLRRIVGEASRKQKVVLVIEEAHRIHGNTLRSLKTLREIRFMGESELFTVVLIGQSDPMNRAGVSEVRLRSDCVQMQGLTGDEASGYVMATMGKYFEESALELIPSLPQANNYLDLQELLVGLLNHALVSGRDKVNKQDVQEVAGRLQTVLPRQARVKATEAPVSGTAALKSVLARRQAVEPTALLSVV